MVQFKLKAAGRVAAVTARYGSTRWYCREYLTAEEADFTVEINARDLAKECGDGPEELLETTALLRKLSHCLLAHDTLLFHGSCIAVDGEGYLFTAPSGTGKSTHTRLWRELLGSRAVMVNDDKPFLSVTEDGITAWGSPWCGKHGLHTNIGVPLKAICILERGQENHIHPIHPREALIPLLQQTLRPRNPRQMGHYLYLLDKLSAQIPFYRLECNMDPNAARMAYEAMSGKQL